MNLIGFIRELARARLRLATTRPATPGAFGGHGFGGKVQPAGYKLWRQCPDKRGGPTYSAHDRQWMQRSAEKAARRRELED